MHMAAMFDPEIMQTRRGAVAGGEYWAKRLHPLAGAPRNRGGVGYYHGGPSRPHLYGVPRRRGGVPATDRLGQWGEIIGRFAEGFGTDPTAAPGGGPSAGGPTTGMQQPGDATAISTAVSPVLQTQISPQISPVFQQTQDSPGATQAATATQYMPGGFYGEGGGSGAAATAAPPTMPGAATAAPGDYGFGPSFPDFGNTPPYRTGGLPVSPLDPVHLTDIRSFPTAGQEIATMRAAIPFNWTPVIWIGGIAAVSLGAIALLNKRKR